MNESRSSHVLTIVRGVQRKVLLPAMLLASSSVLLLSGCGSSFNVGQPLESSFDGSGLSGKVIGGQQAVTGGSVQIYDVGATAGTAKGFGGAATAVGTAVTSDSNGNWSYGAYSCASPSDELYVVATGGNPGLAAGTNNSSLALAATLGPCSSVNGSTFIDINEATTIATAYALSGFMTNATHVATGTDAAALTGLTNAFATANNLVNVGAPNSSTAVLTTTPYYAANPIPPNVPGGKVVTPDTYFSVVPTDTIDTLADVLAACVNTDGGSTTGFGGGVAGACGTLNGITGGETTLDAALWFAHHPTGGGSSNISTLIGLVGAQSPYQPTLANTPTDLSMTLNFTGGGLGGTNNNSRAGAEYLAIDANGDIWVPNTSRHSVTELSNLGVPLSPTTYFNSPASATNFTLGGWGQTSGIIATPEEVTIDQNNVVWLADDANCLVSMSQSGTPSGPFTAPCVSGGALDVSVDASNQIWLVAATSGSITAATNPGGALVSGFPVADSGSPAFVGPDYLGNTWYYNQANGYYGAIEDSGTQYFLSTNGPLSGPGPYAAFGNLSGDSGNNGLTLWVPTGAPNIQPIDVSGGSVAENNLPGQLHPDDQASSTGIAADGASNFYMANVGGDTGCASPVPENITILNKSGSEISPSCIGIVGPSSLTALNNPDGVAVDQSGNVWVVNFSDGNPRETGQVGTGTAGHSNVTEFVGLGVPVQPVFSLAAKAGATAPSATNTPGSYGNLP